MKNKIGLQKISHRGMIMLALVILLIFGSAACAADTNETDPINPEQTTSAPDESQETTQPQQPDNIFALKYQGVNIELWAEAEPVIAALGDSLSYFEAESCAFEGLDKIYTYSSIELSTVPLDGIDHISLIVLLDDTVATNEGIRIGSSVDDVVAAYGDDYNVQGQSYTYIHGETMLMFIFEDDVVAAIEYIADLGV